MVPGSSQPAKAMGCEEDFAVADIVAAADVETPIPSARPSAAVHMHALEEAEDRLDSAASAGALPQPDELCGAAAPVHRFGSPVPGDVLQAAAMRKGIDDICVLAQADHVWTYCARLCHWLEDARTYLQQSLAHRPTPPVDALVQHHLVPFLMNFNALRAQSHWPEHQLAPRISYFSAAACLHHLISMDMTERADDPILGPLHKLPQLPLNDLVQLSLLMLHTRTCGAGQCPLCNRVGQSLVPVQAAEDARS
ncbi:uncharacterized protein MONBRDRAFT_29694 [Monosiga brevicollis MX1]|uniref:Uncharacterized protein n=1 Tax=Monosiga brevicollis TaxID=81824 RepID=A9VBV1_MONBE|nr:uncharacterized protein MONBRDRAFT_29694 [Monosiga brevicollis MX1]EDQ85040.1 predicted protein [Monosiga brevicollis MX1]|eukprot:XP_001750210.1 hypothetical protein [Monosiga brevicollis MX1]